MTMLTRPALRRRTMAGRASKRALRIAVMVAVVAGLIGLPTGAAQATTDSVLTVSKAGTGTGTVTSSPAGIDCGTDCEHAYPFDVEDPVCEYDPEVDRVICTPGDESPQSVTLTATAASGSAFTEWSGGGCSGTGTCTVTMDESKTVTATFADTQAPVIHSISPADGAFVGGWVTLSASVSDNRQVNRVYFWVMRDSRCLAVCGSNDSTAPYAITWLSTQVPDGPAEVRVMAEDWAGNSSVLMTHDIVIDNTAPELEIKAGPADGSSSPDPNATFEFTASDPSGVTIRCHTAATPGYLFSDFEPCETDSSHSFSNLVPDDYKFVVSAQDALGNWTYRERAWTVTRMPTAVSFATSKTSRKVIGKGVLRDKWEDELDPIANRDVSLTLFKKKSGRFVKLSSKSDGTDESGRYSARFSRPKRGTCKIKVKHNADHLYLGSKKAETFRC